MDAFTDFSKFSKYRFGCLAAAVAGTLIAMTIAATSKPRFSLPTIPEPARETFLPALQESWATGDSDRLRDLWGPAIRVTPDGLDKFPEGATPRGTLTPQKGEYFTYGRIHFWRGRLRLQVNGKPITGLASIFFSWQAIGGGWKVRYFMDSGPLACSEAAAWPLGKSPGLAMAPAAEIDPSVIATGLLQVGREVPGTATWYHDNQAYKGTRSIHQLTRKMPRNETSTRVLDEILEGGKSIRMHLTKVNGPAPQRRGSSLEIATLKQTKYFTKNNIFFRHLATECPAPVKSE